MKSKMLIAWAILSLMSFSVLARAQGLTIEEAQRLARDNYPAVKRLNLIDRATAFSLDNIGKNWLPRLSANMQATWQNRVTSLPDMWQELLKQVGGSYEGLHKDQYRIGIEVSQPVYDGGAIKASKAVEQAHGAALRQQAEVELYALRQRINDLFFGVLLSEERIKLIEVLDTLLSANHQKLQVLVKNGVALQADADAMKVEQLAAQQQRTTLTAAHNAYRQMLELFIGKKIGGKLIKPTALQPVESDVRRPELLLFEAQVAEQKARLRQFNTQLRPTVGAFAQGFYGYPGLDMFKDMFSHRWSFNAILGLRVNWTLSAFYTRKNDKHRIALAIDDINYARETFMLNTALQSAQQSTTISQYNQLIEHDEEIVTLRESIRKTAEAKLSGGVIDVSNLIEQLTKESEARINRITHELEKLKAIYNLKTTLNQ